MRIRRQTTLISVLFLVLLPSVLITAGLSNKAAERAAALAAMARNIARSATFLNYLSTSYLIGTGGVP